MRKEVIEFLKGKDVEASILVGADWSHNSMGIESMYWVPATIQKFSESNV